jgi:hypothetical protein
MSEIQKIAGPRAKPVPRASPLFPNPLPANAPQTDGQAAKSWAKARQEKILLEES